MVVALFVGRFQPLHKGHLHAIKEAIKKFDEVIIGIGSINKSDSCNPFTFEERVEMLRRVGLKCKIIGIEDVGNDEKWAKLVLSKAEFDVVVSGSDWVKRCFKGIKKVVTPTFLKPEIYNGTKIREKIWKGQRWEDLVPAEVVKYIEEIGGVERIRRLMNERMASR